MLQGVDLLRQQYNYALRKRLDWLNHTRCGIDRCSLALEPDLTRKNVTSVK